MVKALTVFAWRLTVGAASLSDASILLYMSTFVYEYARMFP